MRPYLVFTLLIVSAQLAFAHATGASLEQTVGSYLVDVGVSQPTVVAGESVRFDFSLRNADNNADAQPAYTDLWVRIAPKDKPGIVFASDLYEPEFGLAGMTYTFSEPGAYELTLRFQNKGESVVEAVFPLPVESAGISVNPSSSRVPLVTAGVLGLLVGGFITFFVIRPKVAG